MRPIRLELSGFTAFREPIELTFDDAPYFALIGPTGAGKSSIIDAITFALFGTVPRLDQRTVAPVITQGQVEARVRFDFAVGDDVYTAARVVRRMGQGASTKECRLERGGEVLAGDADGVTREVERVIGLDFDQFTKCVVLPQGAFARFLHDKPADRGDLLVSLLDLGVYPAMQQRANARATEAALEAGLVTRRLEDELSFATAEARDETQARIVALEELMRSIDEQEPRLEALRETVRATREAERAALTRIEALAALRVPDDVAALSATLARATEASAATEEALGRAEEAARLAEKAFDELPPRAPLDEARAAHRQRAACAAELEAARAAVVTLASAEAAATAELEARRADLEGAQDGLERARLEHRAHDLARALRAGEPCPVCRQDVTEVPAVVTPGDLEEAERTLAKAREREAAAAAALAAAARDHASAEARATQLAEQLARLDDAVAANPDPAALDALIAGIEEGQRALEAARKAEAAARAEHGAAAKAVDAARATIERSWRELDGARDRVADLSPPPPAREDLAADWTALATWAVTQAEAQQAAIGDAARARVEAEGEGARIVERQRAACEALGIADAQRPRDACIAALERARGALERIVLALEAAGELRAQLAALEERAAVAKTLSQHLKANAFEAWILDEALRVLQEGATEILAELSAGQYSLTLDRNRNFAVIDHRNADEVRSAKTLSGGETFLASLALALALSDRIAQLSANSGVRLESIFLDEGFGTLDAETLDTVEAAIANLAAGGRVVGIVTHVRDLAERVPVRFEVTKGPQTSTVEKVLA